MIASHPEYDLMRVNFIAEVNIVNFISVTLIHIASKDQVEDAFRSEDAELSEDSQKLALGDMTALGDVKVLELGLQMDAAVRDHSPVLIKILNDLVLLICCPIQILSSRWHRVILCDRLN
jgi:hypothetical protein